MNKKNEESDLVNNNFVLKKFNITDEEFNELSADTKCQHLQKIFKKIKEPRKVKSITEGTNKETLLSRMQVLKY